MTGRHRETKREPAAERRVPLTVATAGRSLSFEMASAPASPTVPRAFCGSVGDQTQSSVSPSLRAARRFRQRRSTRITARSDKGLRLAHAVQISAFTLSPFGLTSPRRSRLDNAGGRNPDQSVMKPSDRKT